jgi:hypothetical protein
MYMDHAEDEAKVTTLAALPNLMAGEVILTPSRDGPEDIIELLETATEDNCWRPALLGPLHPAANTGMDTKTTSVNCGVSRGL